VRRFAFTDRKFREKVNIVDVIAEHIRIYATAG
jgi:hypothetical protein